MNIISLTGWLYMVFEADNAEATNSNRQYGAYLRNRASVTFLEKYFESIYETCGKGVSTSDDEIFHELAHLREIRKSIEVALIETKKKPKEWEETVAYEHIPFSETLGPPIIEIANRDELLDFLETALNMTNKAISNKSYLIWAGGE